MFWENKKLKIAPEKQSSQALDSDAIENKTLAMKLWYEYPNKPKCLRMFFRYSHLLIGVTYPAEYPKGNEFGTVEYELPKEQFLSHCDYLFCVCWKKARAVPC